MKKESIYIQKWLPGKIALVQVGVSRDGGWYDNSYDRTKITHHLSFCRSEFDEGKYKGYRLIVGPLQVMIGW